MFIAQKAGFWVIPCQHVLFFIVIPTLATAQVQYHLSIILKEKITTAWAKFEISM